MKNPLIGWVLAAGLLALSTGCSQPPIDTLDRSNVRDFIRSVDDATTDMDADGVVAFMSDTVSIRITMVVNGQVQRFTLGKTQYEKMLREAFDAATDYQYQRRNLEIDVQAGGQTAIVEATTDESITIGGQVVRSVSDSTTTIALLGGEPKITKIIVTET